MNNEYGFFRVDPRPSKHGWCGGMYTSKCRCCGKNFIGDKRSYHCADCAYTFDEQLTYETLWGYVGRTYTFNYILKQYDKKR